MTDSDTPVPAHDLTEEFVQLLSLHQPRIFAFVLALVPHAADAEEVMQETSLHLWRRFSEYERGTNFRAWACQIAHFKALEFRRANPLRNRPEFPPELIEQIADAASQQADSLEQRRLALIECIKSLGVRDRDLIERRIQPGSTMSQISQAVGRPVPGLYKAFARIYHLLHECVERKLSREGRA